MNLSDATREVFEKTLGFFCALISRRCPGQPSRGDTDRGSSDFEENDSTPLTNSHATGPNPCNGPFLIQFGSNGQPFLKYMM